jgi:hypothetical protein
VAAELQGPIGTLSRRGAVALVALGVLWALVGAVILLFRPDEGDDSFFRAPIGIAMLIPALVQVVTGIFAWRGSGLARAVGILLGLVFGVGSVFGALAAVSPLTSTGALRTVPLLVVFIVGAAGYLYTLVVFIFRWHRAA